MKITTILFIGVIVFFSFATQAQDKNQECERLKSLAQKAIEVDDFPSAATYLLKAERICDSLEEHDLSRLFGSLKTVINEEQDDESLRQKYTDTLLGLYDRYDISSLSNKKTDLEFAAYIMQSDKPDYEKADSLFQRGIKENGAETHESYLVYAYYTIYVIYNQSEGQKKSYFKTRLLTDYLFYKDIIDNGEFSEFTQETLNTYFEYPFPSCKELLPEVKNYTVTLPRDTLEAIHSLEQFVKLIEDKRCEQSKEYQNLIDAWLALNPHSLEARLRKIQITYKGRPLEMIDSILPYIKDSALITQLIYQKAFAEYRAGQYRKAYSSGLLCTGKYKSKGLLIAAQSVAATANVCGSSTFDRKCNYIYAAQLAKRAGQDEKAEKYKAAGPPIDCLNEFKAAPIKLDCWGVTVYLCP